jgi:hypothetical protein
MTEHQTTELLERATADLRVDPDLVAGAVNVGRRRHRRHLVGTAAATVAVLGVVGTGLTVALSGDGSGGTKVLDPATSTPHRTTTAPRPAVVQPWTVSVEAVDVPATFGALLPGTIAEVPNKEMDDANPIVDFQWNGFATRVGLVSDSYITGQTVADPLQRCQEFGSDQPCTAGRLPGSFEQSMTWTGPAVDGGTTTRALTVYFAEGWDVTVMMANAADKDGPPLTPDVPLTMNQLRSVAYSNVWFGQG